MHGIAKSSAKDDAERGVEEKVIGMALRQRSDPGWRIIFDKLPVSQHDTAEIGEAVPFDGKKAQINGNRGKSEALPKQRLARCACGNGGGSG